MAISGDNLKRVIDSIGALREQSGVVRVLSLGYPDLLVSSAEMEALIGAELTVNLAVRKDSADIIAAHGQEQTLDRVFDAHDLFEKLECDFTVFDISRIRGDEQLVDLNHPVPSEWLGYFHLIIDPGTLEHCFNVAMAIKNIAMMAAPQGRILHHNPLTHLNHGFYNFSPTFYFDFYAFNGFEILEYPLIDQGSLDPWDMHYQAMPPTFNNLLATRCEQREIGWPPQGYYRNYLFVKSFQDLLKDQPHITRAGLAPAGQISALMVERNLAAHVSQLVLFDNYKQGTDIGGILVETMENLKTAAIDGLFITSISYEALLIQQLAEWGFPPAKTYVYRDGDWLPLPKSSGQ